MISVIFLVVIACVSKSLAISDCLTNSEGCNNTGSGNTGNISRNVYQKLELAEELIKSAKEKVCVIRQSSVPSDCEDLMNEGVNISGVYLVWPKSRVLSGPISVYCDMETDGGGWTVIQRRGDYLHAMDYFDKNWAAFKAGFGNLKEDFWLGNDNIYALSNQQLYSIRFDLGAFDGSKAFAVYSNFWIDDEYHNYTLHVSGYSGTAGDSFSYHDGSMFSTKERDNDVSSSNCAVARDDAWWFKDCQYCHLNGKYYKEPPPNNWEGIIWSTWKDAESLSATEMKIRKISNWIR